MTFTSLRTAAVAAGAALLTCGAFALTQDAATANYQVDETGLTLAGPRRRRRPSKSPAAAPARFGPARSSPTTSS